LALENAASIAGTVLLTECTLTQDKQSFAERMNLLKGGLNGQASEHAQAF